VVQGFTGAVPDTVVQAAAPWHIYPERYFSPGQCRFGDKGMLGSVRVLLTREGPATYIRGNRNYDCQHARRRISAEKVMTVLKGRFASLEELRAPVASDADVTRPMELARWAAQMPGLPRAIPSAVLQIAASQWRSSDACARRCTNKTRIVIFLPRTALWPT